MKLWQYVRTRVYNNQVFIITGIRDNGYIISNQKGYSYGLWKKDQLIPISFENDPEYFL